MKRQPAAAAGNDDRPLLAISANSAWNILNFRRPLLKALLSAGYRIAALVPPGDGHAELDAAGVRVISLPMSPRGLSPISDARLFLRYCLALRRLRPAAFLGFTAKPNIYGSLAAAALGVPVINNITGLGTSFLSSRLLERVVSILYRAALRRSALVFFHNRDDLDLFVARGIVRRSQSKVIPGSGIDLAHFAPLLLPSIDADAVVFLFIGRMLVDKGITEFAEAAAIVKDRIPGSRFGVLGDWSEHPKAAPRAQLETWKSWGLIDFAGTTDDVRPFIAAADCVVLPSYREGLPRALLEGSAMGRPVIGTDVPGCREVVVDGVTGYRCAPRSADALAEAMLRVARLSIEERAAMGQRARLRAEELFSEERVSDAYVDALANLLA